MRKMHAHAIAAMSKDELWGLEDGPMQIVFDDGILTTNARNTIFSAYFWAYHQRWDKAPLVMKHHIGEREFGGKIVIDMLSDVLFDTYFGYEELGEVLEIEDLCKLAYEIVNDIYNDFTMNCEEYVTSLNILDMLDVIDHPKIQAAKEHMLPTQRSIKQVHATIKDVLTNKEDMPNNQMAIIARMGLVSMDQLIQCVGPRGFITDIDSNTFRDPVMRGYIEGLVSLYDVLTESRSAAKSLMFAKDPLAESEYHNRKQQLSANVVQNLHRGDCGSTRYAQYRLKASDLTAWAGKYYLDEETGKLKVLKASDRHMAGQLIKYRTVPYCTHPDPVGVCSTCFGQLALSIPKGTNLGHVSATVFCEIISQLILSVKHLDGSSTVEEIKVNEYDRRFIEVRANPQQIYLTDEIVKSPLKLRMVGAEAKYLGDVHFVASADQLPITRVTELTDVALAIDHGSEADREVQMIPVEQGGRKASLTHEALAYVKEHRWEILANGDVEIDLKHWNNEHPLFELPLKHVNMMDFMKRIEAFLRSTDRQERKKQGVENRVLAEFDSVDAAIAELHGMVSAKLMVPVSYLEVLIYSCMVRSLEDRDHRLPKNPEVPQFGTYNDNMALRSFTGVLAYQNQDRVITSYESYVIRTRPDHVLDELVMG